MSRIHNIENKVKVPTLAVQTNFAPDAVVPERLYIGFLTFELYDYVPQPTGCFKCLSLGHISKFCRQKKPEITNTLSVPSETNRSVQPVADRILRWREAVQSTPWRRQRPPSA